VAGGARVPSIAAVDAFTSEPFRGNPAAVCILDDGASDHPVSDDWMQAVAAEMNLSETAFVAPRDGASGTAGYGLRWFTPTQEVLLCGHATLASAHILWETGALDTASPAHFHTRWKGELVARREGAGIALDLPSAPSTVVAEPDGLEAALGAPVITVASNDLHHVVELADAPAVRSLAPDLAALLDVDVEAVTVTAASDDPAYDFVSRYFAPRHGIREDPVTGSAHTSLGPWWAERLGRPDVVGYQASRRGGVVRVHAAPGAPRVTVSGEAVTVWRGQLT
jgi:predicted PhzF superfamily epimerase YddE/YHI9